MAVTAYLPPGSTGGNGSNVGRITESDGSYASINSSQNAQGFNFGFNLPSGATIDGVEVRVEYRVTAGTWTLNLNLIDSGDIGSVKTTTGITSTTKVTTTYGSSSDLWGATLTQAIVNGTPFGIELDPVRTAGAGNTRFEVDFVEMRIHYTEAVGTPFKVRVAGDWVSSQPKVRVAGDWVNADKVTF